MTERECYDEEYNVPYKINSKITRQKMCQKNSKNNYFI